MYDWRRMTDRERADALASRRAREHPWHAPPTSRRGDSFYHITSACFEHAPILGRSPERLTEFEAEVLTSLEQAGMRARAWCFLPNHYHLLVELDDAAPVKRLLGRAHGRSSCRWNREEGRTGRKVWYKAADRYMRGERHFWATINYIHNNPVKHGYVKRWQDWPWSSAAGFLKEVGHAEGERIWREFPVLDYGKGWDV